jgi:hypothetical protein
MQLINQKSKPKRRKKKTHEAIEAQIAEEEKKIWTISRFMRVILAQGPC